MPAVPRWNELIERYHYLGFQPLTGARLRYLILDDRHLLGAWGFGAATWRLAPRDRFIGWTDVQRQAQLHLVVNKARFLLLPWVRARNLASAVLALAARQVQQDWLTRYRYRAVLLETFVDPQRYAGTCYKAANWIALGHTQGRGKLDRYGQRSQRHHYSSTPAHGLVGDADGDGAVTAVDALCILRAVAGLPATGACPALAGMETPVDVVVTNPGGQSVSLPSGFTYLNFDASGNDGGSPTAVDALCTLRIVAGLPGTSACPAQGAATLTQPHTNAADATIVLQAPAEGLK